MRTKACLGALGVGFILLSCGAAHATWDVFAANRSAGASARSAEGVVMQVACSATSAPRLQLRGYGGGALSRLDDAPEPLLVTINSRRGTRAFSFPVHYFAPDQTYVSSGPLGGDWLRAWAAGSTMTVLAQNGAVVARYRLDGTLRAFRAMQRQCGAGMLAGPSTEVPWGRGPGRGRLAFGDRVPGYDGRDDHELLPDIGGVGEASPLPLEPLLPDESETSVEPFDDLAALDQPEPTDNKAVRELARELTAADACAGSAGQPEVPDSAIIVRDLTSDGLDDALVDYDKVLCSGSRLFCGAQACSVRIYVNEGGKLRQADEVHSIGVSVNDREPPTVSGVAHGGAGFAIRWDGSSFVRLD